MRLHGQADIEVHGMSGEQVREVAVSILSAGKWKTVQPRISAGLIHVNTKDIDSICLSHIGFETARVGLWKANFMRIRMIPKTGQLRGVRVCGRKQDYKPTYANEVGWQTIAGFMSGHAFVPAAPYCKITDIQLKVRNLTPEDTVELMIWESWSVYANRQVTVHSFYTGLSQKRTGYVRLGLDTFFLDSPDTLIVGVRIRTPQARLIDAPRYYVEMWRNGAPLKNNPWPAGATDTVWTFAPRKTLPLTHHLVWRFTYWD